MENNEDIRSWSSGESGSFGHHGCQPLEQRWDLTVLVDTATRSILASRLEPRPQPTWASMSETIRMALAMENIKPSAESEAEFEVEADGPTPSEDANVEGPDEDNLRH